MAGNDLSAKLAVILHADVVGSTELVRRDEKLTHARIRDSFHRLGAEIGRYSGKVRELRGDALLAEFERASDAVCAALAFQARQAERLAGFDDPIRPVVRVGIALGEVVIADNTITGSGVVLAQRLEQLAEPGGLCITPAIREALPARLPLALDNLGPQQLKGFDHEIEVYRVTLRPGAAVPPPEARAAPERRRGGLPLAGVVGGALLLLLAAAAIGYLAWRPAPLPPEAAAVETRASERPTIAVLPFDNLSGDPHQDYFADGITEDLTTDLSRISGLFVVSRNSAFTYRGRAVDVRTVGAELGVRYVLEGSVRRAGEQLRINAQLVDASNGGHVWAARFDGTMADVFALQDDVNRQIVAALEVKLTPADVRRLERVETVSVEAYDLLLRGVEQFNTFRREALAEAREWYRRALAIDPNYARAYANIALSHATDVNFYWTPDREQSIRLGLENAARAERLDDSIPQVYLTRSLLYLAQRDHEAALEAARRTIEVHPDYADGYATLAFVSSYSGRYEEALAAIDQARRINPQSTGIFLGIEGRIYFLMERYRDALRVLEAAVERNPGFDRIHLHLAAVHAELGNLDAAAWSVEEALAISPDISLAKERREALYQDRRDLERYLGALRKAGVAE